MQSVAEGQNDLGSEYDRGVPLCLYISLDICCYADISYWALQTYLHQLYFLALLRKMLIQLVLIFFSFLNVL